MENKEQLIQWIEVNLSNESQDFTKEDWVAEFGSEGRAIYNYIHRKRAESVKSLHTEDFAPKKMKLAFDDFIEKKSNDAPSEGTLGTAEISNDFSSAKLLSGIRNVKENLLALKHIMSVPFASIIQETDLFSLDKDRCFTYQGRNCLQSLWKTIKETRNGPSSSCVNVIGTVGFGKSYMLAALAAQLTKEKYPVIYIPSCSQLLTDYKKTIFLAFKMLFPSVSNYDQVCAIIATNKYKWIVIADQWNSIDAKEYESIRHRFFELFGPMKCIVKGMSMNSTVWNLMKNKEQSETNIFFYGGFDEEEFSEWIKNQTETLNRKLFEVNKDELVRLTGRVPLYLSIFESLYHENITWDSLVEAVMADIRIKKFKDCLVQFYKPFDAAIVWKVYYALLSKSMVIEKDHIDRRFFYVNHGQLLATGEISTTLLYSVWKMKAADNQIITNWPHLLKGYTLNGSSFCFLVGDVIKAVVCRDGISKYIKKNYIVIERKFFMPGREKGTFIPSTQDHWRLYDPHIYNYAGVDMVLVTETAIVGIQVTIASTYNSWTRFFETWKPIADENHLSIEGLFVASDDFTHDEENVAVVYLKNVYHKLWKVLGSIRSYQNCRKVLK
ncbi:hypothetical protein O9G_003563 [Rozella allomycis CSF55]|uniref:Uncharacterized protein n=1 Tax=Rozella allomycis (strain CSF55) TaxID=988480 RepID=A0A075B0D9_ROZAC|nr:hypothetical protein O9G_003563 [Rozella allomycis CSF55]|eukprot:EPZ35845.1 hypothetical protein O9G_003563 [Rozella allomycis CSF55]